MIDPVKYYTDEDAFCIDNYTNAKAFASFFPGIAGLWGKPMWVFYVNRGQAIAGFGTRDKNGAIMEFLPANKAWRYTPCQGFRTFIKIHSANGAHIYEPFSHQSPCSRTMRITTAALELRETNPDIGLSVVVTYFQLPNEPVPALVRTVTLRNETDAPIEFDCLDGLPAVVPCGLNDYVLKNISRLGEGLFSGVEYSPVYGLPCYKLKVQPADKPDVLKICACNFYAGWCSGNNQDIGPVSYIVDPDLVFGNDSTFTFPEAFAQNDSPGMTTASGMTAPNKTATAFGCFHHRLFPRMECTYFSLIGMAPDVSTLDTFFDTRHTSEFIHQKRQENNCITQQIADDIATCSSNPMFDAYCRQTYIDNLLRGGYPTMIGPDDSRKCLYVYSRIHGDMEREYNNFVIEPQYYSQGNGNFRDVCQNRRNDVFFNPASGDTALTCFANLLQLDGYNPLGISGTELSVRAPDDIASLFPAYVQERVRSLLAKPFRPGAFFAALENAHITIPGQRNEFLNKLIAASDLVEHAEPVEGYWTDHWHYITDLFESYCGVFPDQAASVLLHDKKFTFYDSPRVVMPRTEKYVLFNGKPRQLDAVYDDDDKAAKISARMDSPTLVRSEYGNGPLYHTSLLAKFLCLVANKFSSLDPDGMGVEYEAQKPGWCDALNGLPGLFGSSVSESLALKRLMNCILAVFDSYCIDNDMQVDTAEETVQLLESLFSISCSTEVPFTFWNASHTAREKFLDHTRLGLSGNDTPVSIGRIREMFSAFITRINDGISRAIDPDSGVIRTCFMFTPESYERVPGKRNWNGRECVTVQSFTCQPLPLFLEGPVHYLRTLDKKQSRAVHTNVCRSGLYDQKLNMFKLNENLDGFTLDIGRIRVFTRGWLENESIWMHMEYKYLLELLNKELTSEFYAAMESCAVWNMDPKIYGRSILENVSFVVSSAHPEQSYHGRGFVSRLSGVTAEFISIWRVMTTGLQPFSYENDELCLTLNPLLKGDLFTRETSEVSINDTAVPVPENSFLCMFLGTIPLRYHNPGRKDTFGSGGAGIIKIVLHYPDGSCVEHSGNRVTGKQAHDVRNRSVSYIDAFIV